MQSNEFDLKYMPNAEDDLKELIADKSKKVAMKAVVKSLKLMASNRHLSKLQSRASACALACARPFPIKI